MDPSGARLVVDTVSLPYVKGSEVDWEDSLVRTGFVVSKNPNAAESCSCRTSFTAANSNPYECIVCFQRNDLKDGVECDSNTLEVIKKTHRYVGRLTQ